MKSLLLKTALILLMTSFIIPENLHAQWTPNTNDAMNLKLDNTYNSVQIGQPGTPPNDIPAVLQVGTTSNGGHGISSYTENSGLSAVIGVVANGAGAGVQGNSVDGPGVFGYSENSGAVYGYCFGSGYAGYFDGDRTYISGNLGIGTANPLEKLHVNGAIRGNELGGATRFQTDHGYIDIGPKNIYNWAHITTDQPKFYFNKEIRMNSNEPGYLNGKIGSYQGDLLLRTQGSTKVTIKRSNGYVGIGESNPTEKLHINGNLYMTGSWVGSDLRLKQDVQDLQYGLEEVLALRPLTYDYNGEGGTESGHFNVGIFAQDLQEIAPEFVSEFAHEVVETTEEVNGAGEIEYRDEVVAEETYLKIYDTGIKYMLINAIKEQQSIIDNQQTQIDELKEMVGKLAGNQQEMILEGTQGYLEQNQPNPFSQNTLIKYFVAENVAHAVVKVYDINGKLIQKARITQKGAGEIQLKSKNLTAGTYSYALVLDGRITDTKQMVISQ